MLFLVQNKRALIQQLIRTNLPGLGLFPTARVCGQGSTYGSGMKVRANNQPNPKIPTVTHSQNRPKLARNAPAPLLHQAETIRSAHLDFRSADHNLPSGPIRGSTTKCRENSVRTLEQASRTMCRHSNIHVHVHPFSTHVQHYPYHIFIAETNDISTYSWPLHMCCATHPTRVTKA